MLCLSRELCLVVIVVVSACLALAGAEETITTEYEEDFSHFPNPEQGFYEYKDLTRLSDDIGHLREEGRTLIWGRINLESRRQTVTLPEDLLIQIDAGFGTARAQGMKVIVRVSYGSRGPGGDYRTYEDPSLAIMKGHLRQLAPLFALNVDVIALFEAGFVGPWGEWHSTTLANDYEQGRDMLFDILRHTPSDRMVVVRYPYLKQRIFALCSEGVATVNAGNAYSALPVARVGHHNDCFLASSSDMGTYNRGGGTREQETAYLAAETLYTVYGGETCALHALNDCQRAQEELALLHGTYLNRAYHPEVLEKWKTQGCFDEIQRRLGARLVLQHSCVTQSAPAGGALVIELSLENRGYAALYNPRKVQILMKHQEQDHVLVHDLGIDPRHWKPGQAQVILEVGPLPKTLPEGLYSIYLSLPDPTGSLQDDPRYSFRCANTGIWDDRTGTHRLTDGVTVTSKLHGNAPGR